MTKSMSPERSDVGIPQRPKVKRRWCEENRKPTSSHPRSPAALCLSVSKHVVHSQSRLNLIPQLAKVGIYSAQVERGCTYPRLCLCSHPASSLPATRWRRQMKSIEQCSSMLVSVRDMMQYNPIEEKPEPRGRWVEREGRGEGVGKGGSSKVEGETGRDGGATRMHPACTCHEGIH
jgi:hypothetical protein